MRTHLKALAAVLITTLLLALPSSVSAQGPAQSVTTNGQSVTFAVGATPAIAIDISGTWTGTLEFRGSTDGSTYRTIYATKMSDLTLVTSTTASGQFSIPNIGFLYVRVTATASITGTAVVDVRWGYAAAKAILVPCSNGSGSPEGAVTGRVGECYIDTASGSGYFKQTGSGNTGWAAAGSTPTSITFAGGHTLDGVSADVTRLVRGANDQEFDIAGSYVDGSNYAYFCIKTASNTARIGVCQAGSEYISEMQFSTGGADAFKFYRTGFGSLHTLISGAGVIYPPDDLGVDDTSTIGTAGNRYLLGFFGRGVSLGAHAYADRYGTPVEGMTAYFNDSNTAVIGATVAGGGTDKVLAVYNGTNWKVAAVVN